LGASESTGSTEPRLEKEISSTSSFSVTKIPLSFSPSLSSSISAHLDGVFISKKGCWLKETCYP